MGYDVEGFGTVNIDGGSEFAKRIKLETLKAGETSELICRLLPSMHSYRHTSQWKFFYALHYGHFGNNDRNPEKPRYRPFACVQKMNYKTKEITQPCAKCDQIAAMRKKYDNRLAVVQTQHPNLPVESKEFKDVCKADKELHVLKGWLDAHNLDKKFYMNVMLTDGSFAVLRLSYTTTETKLKKLLQELRDNDKVDAFSPHHGVWLKFSRTGGFPVTDLVSVVTDEIDIGGGRKARVNRESVLTPEQIQRALKICPDLATDIVTVFPNEVIKEIVATNGDLDKVDAIWARYENKGTRTVEEEVSAPETTVPAVTPPTVTAKAAAPVAIPTVGVVDTVDEEEKALQAQMEALKARKAAAKAATQAIPAATTSEDIADFLSSNFSE